MTRFNLFRTLCGAALLALFALGVRAQDETAKPVQLPTDAVQAIATYEKAVQELEKKLAAGKAEAAKACDKRLMAAIKSATQKGDLDVAVALKAKWTEICGQEPDYKLAAGSEPDLIRFKTYTIVDATFGVPGQTVSAMAFAREVVKGKTTVTTAKIGADPAPNARKSLTLTIANARGVKKTLVVLEGLEVDLDEVLK
jgi:hypothetical protein